MRELAAGRLTHEEKEGDGQLKRASTVQPMTRWPSWSGRSLDACKGEEATSDQLLPLINTASRLLTMQISPLLAQVVDGRARRAHDYGEEGEEEERSREGGEEQHGW